MRRPKGYREYRFDTQGRLVDIPQGAERLLGSDRESVIGTLFSRFLLENVPPVIEAFIRVLRGERCRLRVLLRRADGFLVPARMDLHPVVRAGAIEQVRGVLRTQPGRTSPVREGTPSTGLVRLRLPQGGDAVRQSPLRGELRLRPGRAFVP